MIADLDADDFETRQKATDALAALGPAIEATLAKALASNPSAEARRRLHWALERGTTHLPLRELRAIEVLESIRSPEARRLLQTLARGSPGATSAREARAALARLGKRPGAKR